MVIVVTKFEVGINRRVNFHGSPYSEVTLHFPFGCSGVQHVFLGVAAVFE